MKKSLITLIGAIALGVTLPALAGPDWQVIEHSRLIKQAEKKAATAVSNPVAQPAGAKTGASSTDEKMAKMMAECTEMMKTPK